MVPTLAISMHGCPRRTAVAAVLAALALAGCAQPPAVHTRCTWVAGRPEPAFDPQGPPDPLRWSLERLLARGLTAEDSSGRIVPDAAASLEWSPDSLTLTFHLRAGLAFADGTPCGSDDFRRALTAGLSRTDHATQARILGAVRGVDRVRAGKPVPALGIEAPDARTLVLRLVRPDPLLPRRLALPGASAPWSRKGAGWTRAAGLGAYRAVAEDPGRTLTLARVGPGAGPDTVAVRFLPGMGRVLWALRAGSADLVWPVPPGLAPGSLPAGYRLTARRARPPRRLLLVMRTDLPPTLRLPTRHALAHGLNRELLLRQLGPRGVELGEWLPGAGRFDFPALDETLVRDWMARAKLGRSFHVVMAYDPDGAGAEVARALQGDWARLGIYVELRARRGTRLSAELLGGLSHLALVESQAPDAGAAAELATVVMPPRGPAVGSFKTGWRTREFDAWLAPRRAGGAPDAAPAQARLAEERVALPLAELPWVWVERAGAAGTGFHPRFGPECAGRDARNGGAGGSPARPRPVPH
ncbi:MAG: hypothetical protein HZC42_08635 [Candidatus Eisenbacteria bacterium]|nr:hypothetical protein [Candidatus Eisenbacteria bacterium]